MADENLDDAENLPQAVDGDPKTPGAKQKRLTPEEWEDCKIKWRSGMYTLSQLSNLYGISRNGLNRRLIRHEVVKGSDAEAYQSKMRTDQLEEVGKASLERDKRIRKQASDTKDFLLKGVDVVARRGLKSLSDVLQANGTLAQAYDDVKTSKEAILMLKNAAETVDKIVPPNEVDDDDLSTLVVEGLTQSDIEELAKEHEEDEALFGVNGDAALDEIDEG